MPIRQTIRSIAVGHTHACALSDTGRVVCWGDASFGEVGFIAGKKDDYEFELAHGVNKFEQSKPRKVFLDLPAPAKEVYAAGFMSCAWLQNDEFWCWGDTGGFHLRDTKAAEPYSERMWAGKTDKGLPIFKPTFSSTLPTSPMKMPDDCALKDITVLDKQICVVCESGCAQCWGFNLNDALGYGDSTESWAPRNECYDFSD